MTTATKSKYSEMSWGDLRILAQSRGVATTRRKRMEIENELTQQDTPREVTNYTPAPDPTPVPVTDIGVTRATSTRFVKVYANETGAPLRNACRIMDADNNCVCTVYGSGRRNGIGGDRTVIDFEGNADKIIKALSD